MCNTSPDLAQFSSESGCFLGLGTWRKEQHEASGFWVHWEVHAVPSFVGALPVGPERGVSGGPAIFRWRAAPKSLLLTGQLASSYCLGSWERVEEGVRRSSRLTLAGLRGRSSRGVLQGRPSLGSFPSSREVIVICPFTAPFPFCNTLR